MAPDDQDGDHQQRGRDRPQDEYARRVHVIASGLRVRPLAVARSAGAPACGRVRRAFRAFRRASRHPVCARRRRPWALRSAADLCAVAQTVAAFRNDRLAGGQPGGHGDALAIDHAQGHRTHRDGAVGIHDVDESAHHAVGRAAAHRGVRHDDLVLQQFLQQLDVDELVRKQRAVGIVELRAQLHRAGGDVDLVVDGQQLALGESWCCWRGRRPPPPAARRHAGVASGWHVVLGNREDDGDGLQLIDHHDAVRIARRDIIALIDLAQSDAAGRPAR